MAQLREGSIIKKSTGDEVVATLNDIPFNTSELTNDSGFITAEELRDLEAEVGELRRIIDILTGGEGA